MRKSFSFLFCVFFLTRYDSLYNYKKINPLGGLTYDNLELIRSFAGSESE